MGCMKFGGGGCLVLVCILALILGCKSMDPGLLICMNHCAPVCLKIDGATAEACQPACKQYCRQVHGNLHPGWFV